MYEFNFIYEIYLQSCQKTERGKILKVLTELTDSSGFDSAAQTINQAIVYQAADADSLRNLYRRLCADIPKLPPMNIHIGIPKLKQMSADLGAYDRCLLGGVLSVIADYQEEIRGCCKKLRLSSNLADHAIAAEGESH